MWSVDEAKRTADVEDVELNIYLYKHEEWLLRHPEYTESPYSAVIAALCGQLSLLEEQGE